MAGALNIPEEYEAEFSKFALDAAESDTPCHNDPDMWTSTNSDETRMAKRLCASCPLMERCFGISMALREPYGVWGGYDEHERAALIRARLNSKKRQKRNEREMAERVARGQSALEGLLA
jgi:hypothetical protein